LYCILEKTILHPDNLQKAQINIIAKKKCNTWLQGKVTPQMMCAGEPQGGRDACTVSISLFKAHLEETYCSHQNDTYSFICQGFSVLESRCHLLLPRLTTQRLKVTSSSEAVEN